MIGAICEEAGVVETINQVPSLSGILAHGGDYEPTHGTRVCSNERTKEALSGEFYGERVRVVKRTQQRWATDETGWLLVKNCEDDEDQERDVRAWFCWGLEEASVEELVSWA